MISEKIMGRLSVEDCQKITVSQLHLNENSIQISIDSQFIELTFTKCYYGGGRAWFVCPNCNKRVSTLFRKPLFDKFLCRFCNDLTYRLRLYHRSPNEEITKRIYNLRSKNK